MADFKTHITTSSAVGVVYGLAGHIHWGIPPSTSILAGCLCGLAGMLPDMDSDSGHAQREIMTFAAAVTPMLMIERFSRLGLGHEQMVLASGCVYVIVRFGFGEILQRYTVHRGMFHSIPAAIIAGMVASIICSCEIFALRMVKVVAIVLGYMIHLALDEIWAIEWYRGRLRFKQSFGTAMKLFSKRWFPNIFTYGMLLIVGTLAYHDPMIMEKFGPHHHHPAFAHGVSGGDGHDSLVGQERLGYESLVGHESHDHDITATNYLLDQADAGIGDYAVEAKNQDRQSRVDRNPRY